MLFTASEVTQKHRKKKKSFQAETITRFLSLCFFFSAGRASQTVSLSKEQIDALKHDSVAAHQRTTNFHSAWWGSNCDANLRGIPLS